MYDMELIERKIEEKKKAKKLVAYACFGMIGVGAAIGVALLLKHDIAKTLDSMHEADGLVLDGAEVLYAWKEKRGGKVAIVNFADLDKAGEAIKKLCEHMGKVPELVHATIEW